jgi:hypothetical protein
VTARRAGMRLLGAGYRVPGIGYRVSGIRCRDSGVGYRSDSARIEAGDRHIYDPRRASAPPSPTGRGSALERAILRRVNQLGHAQRGEAGVRGQGLPRLTSQLLWWMPRSETPHPGSSALASLKLIHSTLDCALQSRPSPVGRGWRRSTSRFASLAWVRPPSPSSEQRVGALCSPHEGPDVGTRASIPDTRYLIPGRRDPAPDTRHLIPDTHIPTTGTRHPAPSLPAVAP